MPHLAWATRGCLILLTAVPLAAQFEASAVIRYTAEELDLRMERPLAMNNRGWIVGSHRFGAAGYKPMRYRPGVGTEQISELNGELFDINDAGTAVGYFYIDGRVEAIIRPAGAPWKRIGTLGGRDAVAFAINEAGQAVGRSDIRGGNEYPFLYTEAQGMKMLVDRRGWASDINESGQVIGEIRDPLGRRSSFLWDPAKGLIEIDDYAGMSPRFMVSGIADNGTLAGYYRFELATFSLVNGLRKIGSLAGSTGPLSVRAINDRGWIVGAHPSYSYPGARAFLYVYGQGIRDLNSLLASPLANPLVDTIDINDRDEILAFTVVPIRFYILKRVRE